MSLDDIDFNEVHLGDPMEFQRLLKDSEIAKAIETRHILIDDPDVYLKQRRKDLIQPASMDIILKGSDTLYSVTGMTDESRTIGETHPNVDKDFVTFWPGYETETNVHYLRWFNGNLLRAYPELRSTLRRVGLDMGWSRFGIGFDDTQHAFLNIRNPQNYPVSVQKGEKIAQVLWRDKGHQNRADGWGVEERANKLGSGKLVTSAMELIDLAEQGDLYLSDNANIFKGNILFHAGKIRTYCNQDHVIIGNKGIQGFEIASEQAINHTIEPGVFSDIETIERIGLSGRVAMQVFYHTKSFFEMTTWNEMVNAYNTLESSGGWIDPGYGYKNPNGAPFSVQRKAFTEPVKINYGDVVGVGVVWYFPESVEQEYSPQRGSHYNDVEGFVSPKL